ncbi:MAG TPA: hypothetical protein V6D17_14030 [Candidatus Obscuribacterales bacterium]
MPQDHLEIQSFNVGQLMQGQSSFTLRLPCAPFKVLKLDVVSGSLILRIAVPVQFTDRQDFRFYVYADGQTVQHPCDNYLGSVDLLFGGARHIFGPRSYDDPNLRWMGDAADPVPPAGVCLAKDRRRSPMKLVLRPGGLFADIPPVKTDLYPFALMMLIAGPEVTPRNSRFDPYREMGSNFIDHTQASTASHHAGLHPHFRLSRAPHGSQRATHLPRQAQVASRLPQGEGGGNPLPVPAHCRQRRPRANSHRNAGGKRPGARN